MSSRVPIHADAYCLAHGLVVHEDGECDECKERLATSEELLAAQLPCPFEEVLGG